MSPALVYSNTARYFLAFATFVSVSRSIDQWHRVNAVCPVCKTKLPKKLLRLFFEPQDIPVGDASTSSVQVAVEGGREGEEGQENVQVVSAEVTRLRREVASSNKVCCVLRP